MSGNQRFIDNGNGTVTDSANELTWASEDTWQTRQTWMTWDEALDYVQKFATSRFAGFDDWRLPEKEEAATLYESNHKNTDKYGKEIGLHPVFPPGPLATIWTADGIGQDGYIVDLQTGEVRMLYKSKSGRMATRPVRGKRFSERNK